jgi:hypothetical protein
VKSDMLSVPWMRTVELKGVGFRVEKDVEKHRRVLAGFYARKMGKFAASLPVANRVHPVSWSVGFTVEMVGVTRSPICRYMAEGVGASGVVASSAVWCHWPGVSAHSLCLLRANLRRLRGL